MCAEEKETPKERKNMHRSISYISNQYHSWFFFKPPPYNFEMLKQSINPGASVVGWN